MELFGFWWENKKEATMEVETGEEWETDKVCKNRKATKYVLEFLKLNYSKP